MGVPGREQLCTAGGEKGDAEAEPELEAGRVAAEHQVRIAGGPNQLPFLAFIPHLISSTVGSLRAAVGPAFPPTSRAPAHSFATDGSEYRKLC